MRRIHPATDRPRTLRGLASANVATVLFGLAGVLGALSGLSAPAITLGRVVFAGVALGITASLRRISVRPSSRRDLALLATQGLILAAHWTAFFESIAVSNVAIGLLAFSSFPLFTAALEPLLLRQRPRRIEVAAALLIAPGVYLLAPHISVADSTTQGILWGVLSGALFALLSVINRGLAQRYAPLTISLYQDATAAIALLPALAFISWSALTIQTLLILLALGVVCTALAHTLFIASMTAIRAQLASLIAALEPVWGIVFALLILHQMPAGRTLLGGAVILLASALPAISAAREQSEPGTVAAEPSQARE